MISKLFFNSLLFVFLSISASCLHGELIYGKYMDVIVADFSTYMTEIHQLNCKGSGGGFLKDINNIHLSFSGIKCLSIEESRSLIVECAEKFLKKINNDQQIKPYLSHYPYTVQGLTLMISFYSNNNLQQKRVPYEYVAFVFIDDAFVCYYRYNHTTSEFELLLEEPYSRACELANRKKQFDAIKNQIKPPSSSQEDFPPSKLTDLYNFFFKKLQSPRFHN